MKKFLALMLGVTLALTSLIGCESKSETTKNESKDINVLVPDGITSMAAAKLMKEDSKIVDSYNMNYSIEKTTENVSARVLKGDVDVAVVPSNLAATQYNKDAGYVIAGTVTWGSFYLVSTDGDKTLDDLKGQEIYNVGKGLTPDITMQSILKDKGYDPTKDYNFSYVDNATDLVPVLTSGKAKYAVIPEPALTGVRAKMPELKVVMDLNKEWKSLNNSEYGYPQAALIVKKDLVENDKKFIDELLKKFEESCKFANDNAEEMASYCEELGVTAKKPVIQKAVSDANINFVAIKDCTKEYETYFNKLKDFNAKTIGGKVPDDAVFMEK